MLKMSRILGKRKGPKNCNSASRNQKRALQFDLLGWPISFGHQKNDLGTSNGCLWFSNQSASRGPIFQQVSRRPFSSGSHRSESSSLLLDVVRVQESEEGHLRMGVAPEGKYLFSIVFIQESAKIALRGRE